MRSKEEIQRALEGTEGDNDDILGRTVLRWLLGNGQYSNLLPFIWGTPGHAARTVNPGRCKHLKLAIFRPAALTAAV